MCQYPLVRVPLYKQSNVKMTRKPERNSPTHKVVIPNNITVENSKLAQTKDNASTTPGRVRRSQYIRKRTNSEGAAMKNGLCTPRRKEKSKMSLTPPPLPSSANLSASPNYAGAKFVEPPQPRSLPKPPSHWVKHQTPIASVANQEMSKQKPLPKQGVARDLSATWASSPISLFMGPCRAEAENLTHLVRQVLQVQA